MGNTISIIEFVTAIILLLQTIIPLFKKKRRKDVSSTLKIEQPIVQYVNFLPIYCTIASVTQIIGIIMFYIINLKDAGILLIGFGFFISFMLFSASYRRYPPSRQEISSLVINAVIFIFSLTK